MRIRPTLRGRAASADSAAADDGDAAAARPFALHFCALKLRDPETFLLAGDNGTREAGAAYLWRWRDDTYTPLLGGQSANCHDIQWSYGAPGLHGALWMPDVAPGVALVEYNATTGAVLRKVDVNHTLDINHAQLINGDAAAVVSSRETDSFVKLDVATGAVLWTLGGSWGEFDVIDERGARTPAGRSYFAGQHNVEYYGEVVDEATGRLVEEYGMFDNMFGRQASSRVLVLRVDADAKEARVSYEKRVGAYCPEFGDADRLPSGNILSTFWVQGFNATAWGARDAREQFDMRAEETVVSTHLPAWRLDVQGPACDGAMCHHSYQPMFTWRAYSVERFYEAPLVWNVSCDGGDAGAPPRLRFATASSFKQQNPAPASYAVRNATGATVAAGSFSFRPHWQATPVNVSLAGCGAAACASGELTVVNEWGDNTTAVFRCE